MLPSWFVVVGGVLGLASSLAGAAPVVEQIDRFELNWSTMRIRFFGEATVDFTAKGFEGAEKAATEDGLRYALASLDKVREQKGLTSAVPMAKELTKQAFVAHTVYFTDGRIRVELESSLPKALDFPMEAFVREEPAASPSEATSILVQVNGAKQALFPFDIRCTDGELMYSPRDVAKTAFKKQMVGRWFYRNSPELKSFQGANPVTIDAVAEGGKTLIVTKESWNKLKAEHPRLLEEAKIAYIIPGSTRASRGSAQ